MLWVISCTDNPNSAPLRAQTLLSHRGYLHDNKDIILLAGPIQTDDGEQITGSLFVINVDGRSQAQAFSDADPFTKAGVFADVTIKRMRTGHWNSSVVEGTPQR